MMKKILAILMALAMLLGFAACGGNSSKDDNDDKDDKEIVTVSEDDAIFEAAEEYYDALVSGKGKKIKASMASVFEILLEEENPFAELSDEQIAIFEQLYGVDLSDPDAIFEILALQALEEYGEVDSISVDDVDYKKLTEEEIEEKNREFKEEGIDNYTVVDAAKGDVDITVVLEDGEEIEVTEKFMFIKEGDEWKVVPGDEDEDEGEDIEIDGEDGEIEFEDDDIITPTPGSDDAAITAAASAYYTALVSGNGARVNRAMSDIFEVIIESDDPFADLSAEDKAEAEDMYGISFSDPNAFYAYYAAMMLEDSGIVDLQVTSVEYEKFSADDIATMNSDLISDGITGINITDCAEAEVELVVTYDDGTEEIETQYITFLKENGSWKAFPDM